MEKFPLSCACFTNFTVWTGCLGLLHTCEPWKWSSEIKDPPACRPGATPRRGSRNAVLVALRRRWLSFHLDTATCHSQDLQSLLRANNTYLRYCQSHKSENMWKQNRKRSWSLPRLIPPQAAYTRAAAKAELLGWRHCRFILGDPGADRGAGGKLGRAETMAEGGGGGEICPWVSEDAGDLMKVFVWEWSKSRFTRD